MAPVQVTTDNEQLGSADDVGMETFKQGAVATEEEQPHASPEEQWAALREGLTSGATISAVSQVMREVCDAVGHEVSKEVRSRECRVRRARRQQFQTDLQAVRTFSRALKQAAKWEAVLPRTHAFADAECTCRRQ